MQRLTGVKSWFKYNAFKCNSTFLKTTVEKKVFFTSIVSSFFVAIYELYLNKPLHLNELLHANELLRLNEPLHLNEQLHI
mgnify:CR=1 FL=1